MDHPEFYIITRQNKGLLQLRGISIFSRDIKFSSCFFLSLKISESSRQISGCLFMSSKIRTHGLYFGISKLYLKPWVYNSFLLLTIFLRQNYNCYKKYFSTSSKPVQNSFKQFTANQTKEVIERKEHHL